MLPRWAFAVAAIDEAVEAVELAILPATSGVNAGASVLGYTDGATADFGAPDPGTYAEALPVAWATAAVDAPPLVLAASDGRMGGPVTTLVSVVIAESVLAVFFENGQVGIVLHPAELSSVSTRSPAARVDFFMASMP